MLEELHSVISDKGNIFPDEELAYTADNCKQELQNIDSKERAARKYQNS